MSSHGRHDKTVCSVCNEILCGYCDDGWTCDVCSADFAAECDPGQTTQEGDLYCKPCFEEYQGGKHGESDSGS